METIDRRGWLLTLAWTGMSLGVCSRSAFALPGPARGTDFVARLALNENPFGPAPGVRAALLRELPSLCRYTEQADYDALVNAVAAKERIPAAQIVLGEILEPLGRYLSAAGGTGGEFIYSDPGYTALIDAAVETGGRPIPVPLDSSLQNDLEGLTARLGERTRAIYLVNPHNPTGAVSDGGALKQFARSASRRTLVIVDEAYLEYADGFEDRTLANLVRAGDDVIVFRTFAKAYGLAGLDVGYALVPARIAQALQGQGLTNPHLFNRLAIAAAAASLRDKEFVRGVSRRVAIERERWFDLLRTLGRRFAPSVANFIFFETGMVHEDFAGRLRQAGVEIGRQFKPYETWARISIGLPEENARARAAVRRLLAGADT